MGLIGVADAAGKLSEGVFVRVVAQSEEGLEAEKALECLGAIAGRCQEAAAQLTR
jgi:hypothetical protein